MRRKERRILSRGRSRSSWRSGENRGGTSIKNRTGQI